MCCCGKPVINGEMGYRWQPNDMPSIRKPSPPELQDHDTLIIDEPGRCGGVDCHSHHYRLVKQFSCVYLLVQHGGGVERIRLHATPTLMSTLFNSDSNQRYWILHTIYYAHHDADRDAAQREAAQWRQAAAEKRIKCRKQRGCNRVKVWIES